jgi:CBS-domain-containing membrane protein
VIRVAQVMSRRIATVSPTDDCQRAVRLMTQHACEYLPVVQQGRVIGLVGRADVESPDRPRGRVETVMSREVLTVRPHTPLAEAARLVRDWRTPALPVVAGKHVAGIVTESMLIAYLADLLDGTAHARRLRRVV